MNIKEVKDYCLTLPHTKAYMPCGDDWMVFHMDGQIFLYIWLKSPITVISVKLVPERGEELREKYGRDDALATILRSFAHEIVHYLQWINGFEQTDTEAERQAERYSKEILNMYAKTREHP